MSRPVLAACALALAALLPSAALAQAAASPQPPTPDSTYDAADAWLCRPGRADTCGGEQAVTTIAADGARSTVVLKPAADAPIDCFYVYPTISTDPNPNSSLKAGPGELRATAQQFAPFASVCRPFAPMYRQVTLAGLRAVMTGQGTANPQLAIEDVRAAWRHYQANDNKGRGVVLIGHSQGTRMLMELIQRDIEGKPEQKRIVSALLIGLNVMVPAGADVGGTFKQMPVCRTPGQTGCVVAFSTFRDGAPPPANARFGRSNAAGTEVACADPVRLSGQPLRPMLARAANLLGAPSQQADWQQAMADVPSPFVSLPGMLKVACAKDGPNSYLALTVDAAARGTRPADIPGDIVVQGKVWDDWGLHLVDVNIAMGNLLEMVRLQAAAYAKAN